MQYMKTKKENTQSKNVRYILIGGALIAVLILLDMEKFAVTGGVIVGGIFWVRYMYKESKESKETQPLSNEINIEENNMSNENTSGVKNCPQCHAEIPLLAKKCSQCRSDFRVWPVRHPILSILIVLVLLVIFGSSQQQTNVNVPMSSDVNNDSIQKSIPLNSNNPSIKQLATLTRDYVGKSFVLTVYAKADNYYNYGFDNESKYYSLKIGDDSVSSPFDELYAYVDRNDTNKQLMNALLDSPARLEVNVSIPTGQYQSGSNAFLKIDSWRLLP
jgi:hypothetical protein